MTSTRSLFSYRTTCECWSSVVARYNLPLFEGLHTSVTKSLSIGDACGSLEVVRSKMVHIKFYKIWIFIIPNGECLLNRNCSLEGPGAKELYAALVPPRERHAEKMYICPICDNIIDEKDGQKGHDSVYCEGQCQAWLRRHCAILSKAAFQAISQSQLPSSVHTADLTLKKKRSLSWKLQWRLSWRRRRDSSKKCLWRIPSPRK